MKFILDGTSSAGKTTILNEFPDTLIKVAGDDILNEKPKDFYKTLENKYYSDKQIDKIYFNAYYSKIANRVLHKKDFGIDIVHFMTGEPDIYKYLPKDTKKILVYSNLEKLTDNINKRNNYSPREVNNVFRQFYIYYTITNDKSTAIDKIDRKSFIKILETYVKYKFTSKKHLIEFAHKIFKSMNITDDNTYYIKPKYNHYDYILITKNKTPTMLKNEILTIFK